MREIMIEKKIENNEKIRKLPEISVQSKFNLTRNFNNRD